MAETLNLALRRNTPDEPWGFRLQGGVDFKTPLSVQMVNPGGVAERCGLQPSDAVLTLNGQPTDVMEHEDAKRVFVMAGMEVGMVIQRGALSVWKPQVTSLADLKSGTPQNPSMYGDPADKFVQKTSLAADKQDPIRVGSAHNRTARPFAGFGGPTSVNAPSSGFGGGGGGMGGGMQQGGFQPAGYDTQGGQGGYGQQDQGNAYPQQQQHMAPAAQHNSASYGAPGQGMGQANSQPSYDSQGSAGKCLLNPNEGQIPGFRSVSPSFLNSAKTDDAPSTGGSSLPSGMRSVRAPVFDANKVAPQLKNHPVCKVCNQQIIGVFVKIMGEPHHAECFKCASCGKNLKNQGYYESGGQLFCDAHGPSAGQTAY